MRRKLPVAFGVLVLMLSIGLLIGIQELITDKSSEQTNLEYFFGKRWKNDNLSRYEDRSSSDSVDNFHCVERYNSNLYIHLSLRPGRTGSSLFQINCLLALTRKFCYKAMIESNRKFFSKYVRPFFDLKHVELHETVNDMSFRELRHVLSNETQKKLSDRRYNWTLKDFCYGYDYIAGQEQYVRSSLKFKEEIVRSVEEYISSHFVNRSTVAVHVRRTDIVNALGFDYSYRSLGWYLPYISRAMSYLRSRHSDLAFIFCSDDITWCKQHFKDDDVYYSPFLSAGYDLALIARCDHMIFTLGGFAWHGAWLGQKKSVIYSKDHMPKRYTWKDFIYPWWTGL